MSDMTDTTPTPAVQSPKPLSRWIPILGFVVLVALGIFAGVGSGVVQRKHAEATVVTRQLDEQFQLGVEAMNNGQYEVAFQHFQFVAQHDQAYSGLQEALTQLAVWMSMSPTPSPTLTPTITPTPDLRGAEAVFNQAKQYVAAQDWTNALNTLDALRKTDPTYKTVEVDGMYYIALRSRGMAKIFPASCRDTNLEGGIYDLTLAERFGPLDGDASSARNFARYYMAGAAFWEVDWVKAQYYFAQTMLGYPNLMDSSCKMAQDRWREATIEYAKQLLGGGQYCDAQAQFDAAFTVYSNDNAQYFATATAVYFKCHPVPPTPVPSVTPTPGGETPTPTPT
jgi:tetratricopeptide (TPR) repeat protein